METAPAAAIQRRLRFHLGSEKHAVLQAFFDCRQRVSVITGPLGSGKTYGAVQRLLLQMCEQAPNEHGVRPTRWLVVRNTFPDLMGTTVRDFRAVFSGLGNLTMGGMNPPTFHVDFMRADGTRVMADVVFLALDREGAVRKLRGYQLTGVWFNELKELQKAIVDMADARHGRYPSHADGGVRPTWHGMIGDTNACDQDHWLYRLAEEERPAGWAFYRQAGGLTRRRDANGRELRDSWGKQLWDPNAEAENLENLPADYYVAQQGGKTEDWIAVNLANEYGFTSDGKPVYPEYVDNVHFNAELVYDPSYPVVAGFDFGRTPAMALAQYHKVMDRWHVIDELVAEDMSASVFGPQAKRYLDREYNLTGLAAWGDPAGDHSGQTVEVTPIQLLKACGIPVRPAPSNIFALRHAAVSRPLTRLGMDGRPGLVVGPKAKMIRKGLQGGYCFRRLKLVNAERYTDEPDKNPYSHPVEALQYALLGGGEGRAALSTRGLRGLERPELPTSAIGDG